MAKALIETYNVIERMEMYGKKNNALFLTLKYNKYLILKGYVYPDLYFFEASYTDRTKYTEVKKHWSRQGWYIHTREIENVEVELNSINWMLNVRQLFPWIPERALRQSGLILSFAEVDCALNGTW